MSIKRNVLIVKVRGSSTNSLLKRCVIIMSTVPTGHVPRPLPHCPGPVNLEVWETPVPARDVGRDATVGRSVAMHSDRETLTAHTPPRHEVKQVWKGHIIKVEQNTLQKDVLKWHVEQNTLQKEVLKWHVEHRRYTARTRDQEEKKWKSM
jgi:hypothetical protein